MVLVSNSKQYVDNKSRETAAGSYIQIGINTLIQSPQELHNMLNSSLLPAGKIIHSLF